MKLTIAYEYTAEVVPPRCRIARRVTQQASIRLNIREVADAEAPVAIREDYYSLSSGGRRTREYRWYGKSLWLACSFRRSIGAEQETQTAAQFLASPYPYDKPPQHRGYSYQSKQEQRRVLMAWAASVLFIDGQRWVRAGEPRYVVMTFGLGCNHGLGWGTSLSTDSSYNSNIGRDRYFRADQFEAAVAAATRIASGRGDTKALPIVEEQNPTRFEILIPEAIRLCPGKEHGEGNAFINQMEGVIAAVQNPGIAGLLGMVAATLE